MKLKTNDRELFCLLVALNSLKPETTHTGRRRKDRAFDELQLTRIEESVLPGSERYGQPPGMFPVDEIEIDMERGTQDYLLEKFGKDGEVGGGAYVERMVSRFIDRLTKAT